MISLTHVKRFCKEYWKIENYDKAVADKEQTWHCHHRHEIDWALPKEELISVGRYYDVHYSELIFLTPGEHNSLHHTGKVGPWRDKQRTEETKQKISDSLKGQKHTPFSDEGKLKMSESKKGNQNSLKYHITKDELYDLYIKQNLSTNKIANLYGCTSPTIQYKLKKYNITKNQK